MVKSTLRRLGIVLILLAGGVSVRAADELPPLLTIPVRVHLLQSPDEPAVHTTLVEADIHRVLKKVNRIWAQAGIAFQAESIRKETARTVEIPADNFSDRWLLAAVPPATRATNAFDLYYVKRMQANGIWTDGVVFVKDTASLREVPGGIDEPLPRVTSHELGHALGLPHLQNITNLMASGTTGTELSVEEIQHARANAKKLPWSPSAQKKIDAANSAK